MLKLLLIFIFLCEYSPICIDKNFFFLKPICRNSQCLRGTVVLSLDSMLPTFFEPFVSGRKMWLERKPEKKKREKEKKKVIESILAVYIYDFGLGSDNVNGFMMLPDIFSKNLMPWYDESVLTHLIID